MLNRRDFIHAGCTVAAASLVPDVVDAAFHGSAVVAAGFSQRSVINMQFQSANTYGMINLFMQGGGNTSPLGPSWATTTDTFPAALGANGWPNISESGSPGFGGSWTFPGSDEYSGAYVFVWDGDGYIFENSGMTWTESNLVTPGSVTITNGNQNIPWSNSFSPGQCIILDTTHGNLIANTSYYVSSAGLTTSNIRLADTKAHAIAGTNTITPSAGGGATLYGPYQKGFNGRWENTNGASGIDAQIIATPSGNTGPQASASLSIFQTNQYGNGSFLNNLRIYQQQDATDMANGLLFRRAFKQSLVNLNPSAVRFMNWMEGGATSVMRFENRRLPNTAGCNGSTDWLQSPCYGNISGTNQYTLAAAVPTTGNPKTTPGSMLNGEIVTCRIPTANYSVRTGQLQISSITNANPGVVTTTSAHGFSTGDKIIHTLVGMTRLNYFPVTVTVTGSTTYTIGVDTTSWGSFVSGNCEEFLSLNVAARGAFPITQGDGVQPVGQSPSAISPSGNYSTFVFDKSSSSQADGTAATFTGSIVGFNLTVSSVTGLIAIGQTVGATNGIVTPGTVITGGSGTTWTVNNSQTSGSLSMTSVGWIYGVWIYNEGGCDSYYPIEWCVALVNEVNALAASQGITNLTHCWLNTPVCALTVVDPDYSTASDWALGLADVATNPSSTKRTSGYSALGYSGASKINNAQLFIEMANEQWNPTFVGAYSSRRCALRYPNSAAAIPTAGVDWHAFQSTLMMRTVKATNFGGNPIKTVLGGFYGGSTAPLNFGANYELINGSNTLNSGLIGQSPGYCYTHDPYVVANGFGAPGSSSNHDCVCIASYFDVTGNYMTNTGTGTFTDDSAMYNGTAPYGSPNQAQALANFVAQVNTNPAISGSFSTTTFVDASGNGVIANFVALCKPLGSTLINYEGGPNWPAAVGNNYAGHVLSSAEAVFMVAIYNSTQWATAQVGYFNRAAAISGAAMQSVYTYIGYGSIRWSYCIPDSFSGTTEGGALTANPTFAGMSSRNQALPN